MKKLLLILFLVSAVVLAPSVGAAVETTSVQSKVVVPGGANATGGKLVLTLNTAGTTSDGVGQVSVAGTVQGSIGADGTVTLVLIPNDVITPAGTYYLVRITTTGPVRSTWTEKWQVDTSPDPVDIGSITRLDVAPGIVVGDFVVYVPVEPTGGCSTADSPTFAEDTNKLCECVASVWSCSALGGTPGGDSVTTNEMSDGVDVPVTGECWVVAADINDVEYIACPGGSDGVGYDEIMEEGSGLLKRAQLNILGLSVECIDNAGRTECTFNAEANATQDQTDTEIRDAVEAATNSNTFNDGDHTKLNGIAPLATIDQTDVEIKTAYEANANTNEYDDAEQTKLGTVETNAAADQTDAEIKTSYELNSDTNEYDDAEQTKLAGIAPLATIDQTDTEIRDAVEAATNSNTFNDADHTNLNAQSGTNTNDEPNAAAGVLGVIELDTDLGGTAAAPTVVDLSLTSEAQGDLAMRGASNWARLADSGVANECLLSGGGGGDPGWASCPASGGDQLGADLDRGDATISGSGTILTIDGNVVTNAKAADMAAYTLKLRNNAGSGDPQDAKISGLTEEGTPEALDWILGELAGGELRKFDVGNLPPPAGDGVGYDEIFEDGSAITKRSILNFIGPAVNCVDNASRSECTFSPENNATADQNGSEIKGLYDGEVFAANSILGNNTGSPAGPIELTATQVRALINVENNATADQNDTEIRDAVEAASNSNTFNDTDHTKLGTIEDSATIDQTDTEIRDAVEAATDSNTFNDADHTNLNNQSGTNTNDEPNAAAGTLGVIELDTDLGGTAAAPTVVDLSLTSEAQGDLAMRGASNWARLPDSGTANECLLSGGGGGDPGWDTCPGGGDGVGYDEVFDEGSGLTKRGIINFIGGGVDCIDNASRTECTIAGGGTSHELLSGTHTDTTTATVLRGDLAVGQQASPKWERLALGTEGEYLRSDGTDAVWATPPCEFLGEYADSGAGTSGSPWIITATGWDKVKGDCITATGFYEIAHGARLDITSGTVLDCQGGGRFSAPAAVRTTEDALFKIDKDAIGVIIRGCEFHPGVTFLTTGPCPHGGSTDTEAGATYFDVGADTEDGAPNVLFEANTFRPPRMLDPPDEGTHIRWWVGSESSVLRDNRFELAQQYISFSSSDTTGTPIHNNLIIDNNVFDGLDFVVSTCQDTDDVIDMQWNPGRTNNGQAYNTRITNNHFWDGTVGVHFEFDGDSFLMSGNSFHDTMDHFVTMSPPNNFNGITISNNSCYDTTGGTSLGCDIEVLPGAPVEDVNIFGNHLKSRGGVGIFLGELNGVRIHDNVIDGDNPGATSNNCIQGGDITDMYIWDNLCIDENDLMLFVGTGTVDNINIWGNTMHSNNSATPGYIINTDGSQTYTNVNVSSNYYTGFDSQHGAWTDDLTAIAYYADQDWQADRNLSIVRVPASQFAIADGATDWSFDADGTKQPNVNEANQGTFEPRWTNPGEGGLGSVLAPDGDGSIRWMPGLVVDNGGTQAIKVDPDATTDGANPWDTDLTFAFGMQLATRAWITTPSATNVYEETYEFSAGNTNVWYLEVAYGSKATGCNGTAAMAVLVCSTTSCVPGTTIHNNTALGDQTPATFIYHEFGSVDVGDIAVMIRYTHNSSSGPTRCIPLLYGVQVSDTPRVINVPDGVDLHFPGSTSGSTILEAAAVASGLVILPPGGTLITASDVTYENLDTNSDIGFGAAQVPQGSLVAPLANPIFSGDPTAPTATVGDSDLSVASTDFVDRRVQQDCRTVEDLTTADVDLPLFIPFQAVTIVGVACYADAAITISFQDFGGVDIETVACDTDGSVPWDTSMSGTATLIAGEVMQYDVDSESTPTWTLVCYRWQND